MWDSSHPDYKDKHLRKGCLDKAVRELGDAFDVKKVKKKWKIMRDYYLKEVKKMTESQYLAGHSEFIYKSKWVHIDKLSFLKNPGLSSESSNLAYTEFQDSFSDNASKDETSCQEDDNCLLEVKYEAPDQPSIQQMPYITSTCSLPVNISDIRPNNLGDCSSKNCRTVDETSSSIKRVSSLSESDDEDVLFCKYVSKRMRKLNDEQKDELKWMITNYFHDANQRKH
ncbi:hypothetical protein CHUAL_013562 [Chamberlinius hualienensis]